MIIKTEVSMKRKVLGFILALCLLIPQIALAAGLSDAGEVKALNHLMKQAAWTPTYVCVALYCDTSSGGTAPTDAAAGTEVSHQWYCLCKAECEQFFRNYSIYCWRSIYHFKFSSYNLCHSYSKLLLRQLHCRLFWGL